MRIGEISISGYRSLRAIRFPVGGLTVFVGANGVGKTNLYRALELLQAAAAGTLGRELASEGGMESALWAGKRMANKPARTRGLRRGDPAHRHQAQRRDLDRGTEARRRVRGR
jgi:predicted ATPase